MNIKTVQVAPFAGAWIEIMMRTLQSWQITVAPFAGAWIEIQREGVMHIICLVAPFAGEWIEIAISEIRIDRDKSLPSRERGLK